MNGLHKAGYARYYDAGTEVTLEGRISAVLQDQPGQAFVACTVDVSSMNLPVETGPSWFLTKQNFNLREGDEVTVIGSMVPYGDSYAVVAREIHTDGRRLFLREPSGSPLWKLTSPE